MLHKYCIITCNPLLLFAALKYMDGSLGDQCVVVAISACRASPSDSLVAGHTVPRGYSRTPTNVPPSHPIRALLTADNDPPFGQRSGVFPPHFSHQRPEDPRKYQDRKA